MRNNTFCKSKASNRRFINGEVAQSRIGQEEEDVAGTYRPLWPPYHNLVVGLFYIESSLCFQRFQEYVEVVDGHGALMGSAATVVSARITFTT